MGNVKSTDDIHFLVSTDLQINSKFIAKNDIFFLRCRKKIIEVEKSIYLL